MADAMKIERAIKEARADRSAAIRDDDPHALEFANQRYREAIARREAQPVPEYRDSQGRTVPPAKVYGSSVFYIGNVTNGRVVFTESGNKMRVIRQSHGATSVAVAKPGREFTTREGGVVKIRATTGITSISRGTIVTAMPGEEVPMRD